MRIFPGTFNLRDSVIFAVLVPLVAVLTVGGILVLTTLEQRLEARLQDDIAVIARTLKAPLSRSLERERLYSLDNALRSASDFERVYGIYVYDTRGEQVARSARSDNSGAPQDIETLDQLGVEQRETTTEYGSIGGEEVYSYFTPLTDVAGNGIGMLQVTRSVREMRDYLDTLRTSGALALAATCAFFIVIVVLGHHLVVGRPLRWLAGAMARVGGGDAAARARITGPSEIRRLAQRFNTMVESINERDSVLARERAAQRRLEQKLRQSEKHALVGRLASGVAHELGAPLSVVDGYAQRLIREKEPGSREHESLSRIRESASRMVTIVQQLLGFGRAPSNAACDVVVERLVCLAAADVRAQFEERNIALEVSRGDSGMTLHADEGRIRQALVHLLRNALYASDARVRVGWRSTEHGALIFVENSGQPIPSEQSERIFEPFFTTKPPGEGSGLGLAVVSGTVADHGGEVGVYESELGGAGIAIELPRDKETRA